MIAEKHTGRAHGLEPAIGARLRARRRPLCLRPSDLALQLCVSFQQVQKDERGANRVAASTLVAAADALRVSVGWLVGEDQPLEAGETDVLLALSRPGAVEILLAFNAIADPRRRNALLAVAEEMAARD